MRKRNNLCSVALSLSLGWAIPAYAKTIPVNTAADPSGLAGSCSLRDAIKAANTDQAVNGCPAGSGADTILFNLSIPSTITLSSTLPAVSSVITIDGSGQNVTISGNHAVQVIYVASTGNLRLQSLTISNGNGFSFGGGGGVGNAGILDVRDSTFSGNSSGIAGAIFVGGGISSSGGTVTVKNSTFSGNEADLEGGGIFMLNGTLIVDQSTFSGNRSLLRGSAISAREMNVVTISNSTFSGNTAGPTGDGIYALLIADSTGTVVNSTFNGNVGGALGVAAESGSRTLNLAHNILANSTGEPDCTNEGGVILNATGPNLVMDGSCAIPGAVSGDPHLDPNLADNGGSTKTHALTPNSLLAIDKGNDTICAASPVNNVDQRGFLRPADGDGDGVSHCDLGAYELLGAPFVFTGFFKPVDNPNVVNVAKAGSAIPITFSLGKNYGLNILAPNSPSSAMIACPSGAPSGVIDQTVTAGASTLAYDPSTNQYSYIWKTDKSWAGSCRVFVLQLIDDTAHTAYFQFR